jgi:hypothetical protein
VEAAFRVLTAALLGLLALGLGAWGLGIFAVLLLIGTPSAFQIARLAHQLGQAFGPSPNTNPAAPLPHELAVALIERVRAAFPQVPQPANLANLARQVWERIHLRPPGPLASVLLLALCGATIVFTLFALVVFHVVPISVRIIEPGADGVLVQKDQVRIWGRLQSSQELNAAGVPHGRFVEYFPNTDQVHNEGAFAHGMKDGIWTTFTPDGKIETQQTYREGVPLLAPAP